MYIVVRTSRTASGPTRPDPDWKVGVLFFSFKNSKCSSFSNTLILFILDQISKNVVVLESPLYKLSIPHKDGPFQPTSGLTRIVMSGLGLGFMGNQNPKNLRKQNPIFFFIPKVKYFNHHIFVIYHDISKSLDVLENPLYQLSIWHKDWRFLPTSGLTRIVLWSPPPTLFPVIFYIKILITFLF